MEILTVKEVAILLKTTPQQVRFLIERGQLQAYNIGTERRALWRVARENIDKLITNIKGDNNNDRN